MFLGKVVNLVQRLLLYLQTGNAVLFYLWANVAGGGLAIFSVYGVTLNDGELLNYVALSCKNLVTMIRTNAVQTISRPFLWP